MVEVVEEAVGHLCGRHAEVAPPEDTNDASVTPPPGSWTRIRCQVVEVVEEAVGHLCGTCRSSRCKDACSFENSM